MTIQNPTVLAPGVDPPAHAEPREEWFERQVGEFKHQYKLKGFYVSDIDTWFVASRDWYIWEEQIVQYHISEGHNSREINAFIQAHALR